MTHGMRWTLETTPLAEAWNLLVEMARMTVYWTGGTTHLELDWSTMHASAGVAWNHELRRFVKINCKTWGLGRMA